MRPAFVDNVGMEVGFGSAWLQDSLWPSGQAVEIALDRLDGLSPDELAQQVEAFRRASPPDGRSPRRMIPEEVFDEIPEIRRTLAREWLTRQGASPEERESVLRPLQRAWLLLRGKRPALWSADDLLTLLTRWGQGPQLSPRPAVLAARALWLSQGDREHAQSQLQRLGEFLTWIAGD